MTKKTVTQLFILLTCLIWVVWDVLVYLKWGTPTTISAVIWRWSWHCPGFPFFAGILCGHLFFQIEGPTALPNQGNT